MSAKLVRKVLESSLESRLKLLAVALVMHGNEDGESIYPSVRRLADYTGHHERVIRRYLAELRAANIFVADARTTKGGRRRTVHYRFDVTALPTRLGRPADQWNTDDVDPFQSRVRNKANPDVQDRVYAQTFAPNNPDVQDRVLPQYSPLNPDAYVMDKEINPDVQVPETLTYTSGNPDVYVRGSFMIGTDRNTNTSTDAIAPVSPTTTERRRKTPAKDAPRFATLCVFVGDFLKRAEPGLSDPDLVEDIRMACIKTFGPYETGEIQRAIDAVRVAAMKSHSGRTSRMTRVMDMLPGGRTAAATRN